MTEGTSQGLFVVVAIVIFGIFVGISYTLFGSEGLSNDLKGIITTSTEEVQYTLNTSGKYRPLKDTDIVYIQDADLERVLKDSLSLSKDAEITLGNMKKLTKIIANSGEEDSFQYKDLKVKSLKGLEYATNLTQLWLHGSAVESLEPIKDLKKLEIINFNDNDSISDLSPLENLINLKRVMLQGNKYTTIEPLKNLTELSMLNVSRNNIEDISILKNMPLLVQLYINETNISDIKSLEQLNKLDLLYIYDTKVTDFSSVSGVKTLVKNKPNKN